MAEIRQRATVRSPANEAASLTPMRDWVEIPVFDALGDPTGDTVRVLFPPPAVLHRARQADGRIEVLELQRAEVLSRFGCGCIREEELRYVRSA